MPGGTAEAGCVYIVRFRSGTIKVGKAVKPERRLRYHAHYATIHDNEICETWVSEPHEGYGSTERNMVLFCEKNGQQVVGEYFKGISFDAIRDFCWRIMTPGLTVAGAADAISCTQAHVRRLIKGGQLSSFEGKDISGRPETRVSTSDLVDWIDAHGIGGAAP